MKPRKGFTLVMGNKNWGWASVGKRTSSEGNVKDAPAYRQAGASLFGYVGRVERLPLPFDTKRNGPPLTVT